MSYSYDTKKNNKVLLQSERLEASIDDGMTDLSMERTHPGDFTQTLRGEVQLFWGWERMVFFSRYFMLKVDGKFPTQPRNNF